MDDKELLVLAAKAASEDIYWREPEKAFYRRSCSWPKHEGYFLPLHDDGEALRLAVALELDVQFFRIPVEVHASTLNDAPVRSATEPYGDDRGAATRRAITRAAAAIGESMP